MDRPVTAWQDWTNHISIQIPDVEVFFIQHDYIRGLKTNHERNQYLPKELDQKSITNDNWLLDMSCNLFDYWFYLYTFITYILNFRYNLVAFKIWKVVWCHHKYCKLPTHISKTNIQYNSLQDTCPVTSFLIKIPKS